MALQREYIFDINKGPNRFKIIWLGFGYVAPNGIPRAIEIIRREGLIARKLRSISSLNNKEQILNNGEQKLVFTQPEIDLIRQRIEAFPLWNPLSEESPADTYDWLNTGKEIEDS